MKISTILKPQPSAELQTLSLLNPRMNLTAKERSRLTMLTKGFEGELKFYYSLQKHLSSTSINLFDLRLEMNKSEFQIDSLLLFQQKAFLIKVKNYEGDFVWNDEAWYSVKSRKDIHNPLQQMQRSELLLKEVFYQLDIQLPIESYIIFINPKFILYNAPRNQQIVFAGQFHRFLRMLNNTPSSLTTFHRELKEELLRRHVATSSRESLPEFDYVKLRKGMMCNDCGRILREMSRVTFKCESCKKEEAKESAILRTVHEFQLLFPDKKITLNAMHEWCGKTVSRKALRKVLAENFEMIYQAKYSHYKYDQPRPDSELLPFKYSKTRDKAIQFFESLESN